MKILSVTHVSYSKNNISLKSQHTTQPINKEKDSVQDFKKYDNTLMSQNNLYLIGIQKAKGIDRVAPKYKNKINIVFADIDGTLSAKNDEVSNNNIEAVKTLNKSNVPLILTTARCYDDTLPIIKSLGQNPEYTIVLQGGSIINKEGKPIEETPINRKSGEKLIDWYNKEFKNDKNAHLIMYFNDMPYATDGIQFPWKSHKQIQKVNNFDELFNKNLKLQKAILYKVNTEKSDSEEIISKFNKSNITELKIDKSGSKMFEFQNRDVSKDKAIQHILDKLNIKTENTMVIGDSSNDIEMLEYIKKNNGLAIAMGNANNKVKQCANAITEDVNSDGFAIAINNLFQNEEGMSAKKDSLAEVFS